MDVKHPWRGIRTHQRHSLVLIVAGAVYVFIGVRYAAAEPSASQLESLKFALNLMSYNAWGYVFIVAGILSIISSRWPPVSETWGYFVLTGQSTAWALFYGAGMLFGDAPWSYLGGALLWGLMAFMWWAISGLVNPRAFGYLADQIVALQTENLELHKEIARLKVAGKE